MPSDPLLLADIPLFQLLEDDERAVLAPQIDELHFPAGQTIYRVGEPGGAMYAVREGEVELWLYDEDQQRVTIGKYGPGEMFGDLSLLDAEPRSTTATTLADTTVLLVDRDDLTLLFTRKPHAALDVLTTLGKRIRTTERIVRSRASRNINEEYEDNLTLGQHLADKIASFGGSWTFVISFVSILLLWILINSILMLFSRAWDPYPFILLNLFLSCLAALQAPIIMMSQNRADAKDRLRSEADFHVNLKAELEIAELHQKLDALAEELRKR
jgi:CRP/FNR family cyclic AMP-dependent transcriptional regulator